jgi:lipopolysaccharide transport system ATP-binding protein
MPTVISVDQLGKKYLLRHQRREPYVALRDVIADSARTLGRRLLGRGGGNASGSREDFWALQEVSFEVQQGDRIGIIGRNGAGKSTLLKILSRITEPTTGTVRLRGRVASLLEVGTGFHPELTGRENIFLNGAILGMSRGEIRRKFDEIVDFAEVERFLDTPVKRYSSGMYVRLAFAVAAHLEPEILVVDEVLAVGDLQFQKKCLGKMGEIGNSGRTLIFVSHNMGAVSELCNKGIVLDRGSVRTVGSAKEAIASYTAMAEDGKPVADLSRFYHPLFRICSISISNEQGEEKSRYDIAEAIKVTVRYAVSQELEGLQVAFIVTRGAVDLFYTQHTDGMAAIPPHGAGLHEVVMHVPVMLLKAGSYRVRMLAGTPQECFCEIEDAVSFEVTEFSVNTAHKGYREERIGQIIFPGHWTVQQL